MVYRLHFLFLFLIIGYFVNAEGTVVLNDAINNEQLELKGNLFYIDDPDNQYNFDNILEEGFKLNLIQTIDVNFYQKAKSNTRWFIFDIENKSTKHQRVYLKIGNPLINDITFFTTTDSVYQHTGLIHPFNQRKIKNKSFIFEINLKPSEKGSVCFRVGNQNRPYYLPLKLLNEEQYFKADKTNSFLRGIFYFLIALTIGILILMRISEQNNKYLYYLLFILALLVLNLWQDSIIYRYLFPLSPKLNITIGKLAYPMFLISILLLTAKVYKPSRRKIWERRFFKIILLTTIAFGVISIFTNIELIYFIILRILGGAVILYILQYIINSKYLSFKYRELYLLGSIIIMMQIFAELFLGYNTRGFSSNTNQTTTISLIVYISIVLIEFLSSFRNSKFEINQLNKNLEQLVDLRTSQLNAQKEELKSQHEELVQQKETLQSQREELRAQKELLEIKNFELEKLSLVASKTDNLIYIFLPNGELDWFNVSFSMLFGKTYEEYKQGEPVNIIDISTNRNIRHVLNTCIREKSAVSYESLQVDKNGNKIWYHTSLTPILDERENIKLLIAIDTDISKLKKYEGEIEEQRRDAEVQKNLAVNRKEELEARQIEIMDSIRYAKRIQSAIMPNLKQIQRDFDDSFVLFLPKDIVSGDFYWYHRIGDKYYIAAIDCTGHGVPGAFMSIIGNYLLNSIIINNQVSDPAEILKQLNRKIKISLKSDTFSQTADGMDVALVVVDKINKKLDFASALRPLFLFQGGDFIESKGDKIPISSNISGTSLSNFVTYTYDFNEGDSFYIFSDGMIDQFGGDKGKKFLTKRFKELLFEINLLSMSEQKEIIKKAFDEWRGEFEQVDDILVMGMRFTPDRR